MSDCVFCKIAAGEIPAKLLHEDDSCVAFADLNPQAPTHLLVIPKAHLRGLSDPAADEAVFGHLLAVAAKLAGDQGALPGGYRVVTNTGPDAGQSVDHLHLHVLAGRRMAWPPG
ncbi:MAG TPA: histidine triad nucleotide-binding protein [Armatimonadota bacterium]|jgi:histidine triad (HIT) family protein